MRCWNLQRVRTDGIRQHAYGGFLAMGNEHRTLVEAKLIALSITSKRVRLLHWQIRICSGERRATGATESGLGHERDSDADPLP